MVTPTTTNYQPQQLTERPELTTPLSPDDYERMHSNWDKVCAEHTLQILNNIIGPETPEQRAEREAAELARLEAADAENVRQRQQLLLDAATANLRIEALAAHLKLPNFWAAHPEAWFLKCEALFAAHKITADQNPLFTLGQQPGRGNLPHPTPGCNPGCPGKR